VADSLDAKAKPKQKRRCVTSSVIAIRAPTYKKASRAQKKKKEKEKKKETESRKEENPRRNRACVTIPLSAFRLAILVTGPAEWFLLPPPHLFVHERFIATSRFRLAGFSKSISSLRR